MPTDHRAALADIKTFPQLIAYLRDEMGWPIARDSFEDVEDLFYDFTADELGIDPRTAAKITEIKRLRPLSSRQPWGIFFVKFEPKKLPVVALRRILSQVALKKRASANSAERTVWAADDLLFVSNYGEGEERQISFAHFSRAQDGHDLPTLKVLGWDNRDTALHLDAVAKELTQHLAWPDAADDVEAWRKGWRGAFTLRHGEVVTTSKELSIRLARLAGDIRDRIKSALAIETDRGPLTKLMKAFQTSLVHDLDAEGFADMYAQTIAYGLLSARIADPHKKTVDDFAGHMRTNPFLRELMETFLKVGGRRGKAGGPGIDFDELGVSEVVQLLDDVNMEAVVLDFGDRNPQEDPVIHFYELFLKEYDAKKRMQRGVFYTPRPVVTYIVRSVDELLRTEFGLEDGLADTTTWDEMAKRHKDLKIPEGTSPDQTFVQILDPATGTGTFLVEVIDVIHKTMVGKWKEQSHGERKIASLWNEYVPKHLLPRLYAYELLMAPYAIAHLKVGLKLYETGYRFGSNERARIYLTNALELASGNKKQMEFAEWLPALAHEAQAVNEVKRKQRFTVVIGNPPYSALSANLSLENRRIVDRYRSIANVAIRERSMLQFEKNIQDDYIKFIALTQSTIEACPIGVAGLVTNHSYLDGPTLRGMRWNLLQTFQRIDTVDLHGNSNKREGRDAGDENVFDIQQGVAIAFLTRLSSSPRREVSAGHLWGERSAKYTFLLSHTLGSTERRAVTPEPDSYLFLAFASSLRVEYGTFVPIDRLFAKNLTGTTTGFDNLLVAFERNALEDKLRDFASPKRTVAELAATYGALTGHAAQVLRQRRTIDVERLGTYIAQFQMFPFDYRWAYLRKDLLQGHRFDVMQNLARGRPGLVAMRQTKEAFGVFAVSGFCGHKVLASYDRSYVFPVFLLDGLQIQSFVDQREARQFPLRDVEPEQAALDLFNYSYAILHSPAYRHRYNEFLKIDFPRLPMTDNLKLFQALASLGGTLVALHLMESPALDNIITTYIGPKNPEVERIGWSDGTVWLDVAATKKTQPATPGTIGFRGVTEAVWNFHIGGYQVCEKWLKDRKGRTLSKDDIAHYQKIVVALSESIRLMKEIDEVIERHGGWPGAFQTGEAKAATAEVLPFRPRTVEPKPEERYATCVPLVPLKAAAGAFGNPQHIEDEGFEWVAVESRHRLRPGMFVAQVVGKSMEPAIPDGAWCLFRAPIEGTRQGKTALVQLRDATDPETGQRYTVKRYESEKAQAGESWRHEKITLKPVNPDFEPIDLTGADEGELQVIAEVVEVLG